MPKKRKRDVVEDKEKVAVIKELMWSKRKNKLLAYNSDLERAEHNSLRKFSVSKGMIDFFSNDYLGLARNKALSEMISEECARVGGNINGSTGSRLLSGNTMYAEELEKEDISAEVIDLRTIRPLDWMTILESVKKTNRLVIVEEQWPFASISSEITYQIQKE